MYDLTFFEALKGGESGDFTVITSCLFRMKNQLNIRKQSNGCGLSMAYYNQMFRVCLQLAFQQCGHVFVSSSIIQVQTQRH